MAQGARRLATATAAIPGYPARCLGYDRDGLAVPCETPTFEVQLGGRCVRCHQLHHRASLRRVDPWVSTNDLRLPVDEGREEREAASLVLSRKMYRQRGGGTR